jgi:hypothetical protein
VSASVKKLQVACRLYQGPRLGFNQLICSRVYCYNHAEGCHRCPHCLFAGALRAGSCPRSSATTTRPTRPGCGSGRWTGRSASQTGCSASSRCGAVEVHNKPCEAHLMCMSCVVCGCVLVRQQAAERGEGAVHTCVRLQPSNLKLP